MAVLSRVKTRLHEDGFFGLCKAVVDRIIAPIHVFLISHRGPYVIYKEGVEVDLSATSLPPLVKYRLRTGFLGYEEEEVDAISKYLDPEADVIELGSGIGFVSCLIDAKLLNSSKHIAVEANPLLIETLERNRARNEGKFTIVNAAYSSDGEEVKMNVYNDYRSSGVYEKSGRTGSETVVEGVTLSSLQQKYDIGQFTLVADIEGAEADMLLSEWETIKTCCDTLILEFHDRNPDTADAKSRLDNSDFTCVNSDADVEVWQR